MTTVLIGDGNGDSSQQVVVEVPNETLVCTNIDIVAGSINKGNCCTNTTSDSTPSPSPSPSP